MEEAFVNSDDPLATGVWVYLYGNGDPVVEVGFTEVDLENMDLMEAKLTETLQKAVQEFDVENIRMMSKNPDEYIQIEYGSGLKLYYFKFFLLNVCTKSNNWAIFKKIDKISKIPEFQCEKL